MKERPILFSAPMVRALLDGSKTQTRRVVKLSDADMQTFIESVPNKTVCCPYGQPGDQIWVRETWRTDASLDDKAPRTFNGWPVQYDADGKTIRNGAFYGDTKGKTRPSLFMPRWASRITLEITGVRVERLQDISEADAIAEGLTPVQTDHMRKYAPEKFGYLGQRIGSCCEPRLAYKQLWNSINGPDSWDANPWVWVIEFKALQK